LGIGKKGSERHFPHRYGGIFTNHLIRAIRDSNGLISNKELIQDVTHRMAAAVVASSSTLNQHPGLYGTKEHGLRLFFGKPRPQPVPQAGLADNS
jgi:hypothetical protein